jgi:hypothetical protein
MSFNLPRWLLVAGIKEEKVNAVASMLCAEDYDTPDRLSLLTESNIKELSGLNASQRASILKAVAALPPPGAAVAAAAVPASPAAADGRTYSDTKIATGSDDPASDPYYIQQRKAPSLAATGAFTYSFYPASRCGYYVLSLLLFCC